MVETILYDKRDRIAYVTLNRPDARNAIDPGMHDELCRVWRDFRDDDDLDVAILSGAIEVIGKPLDDQLRIDGWNSYTCVDRDEATALLRQFYDKTDAGRAGAHATPLQIPVRLYRLSPRV